MAEAMPMFRRAQLVGNGEMRSWIRWPEMTADQRQTFAFLALFVGEAVLTLLWVGLYVFEWLMHQYFDVHSEMATQGQDIVWRLMAIHAGIVGAIALGQIVSISILDFFKISRGDGKE